MRPLIALTLLLATACRSPVAPVRCVETSRTVHYVHTSPTDSLPVTIVTEWCE